MHPLYTDEEFKKTTNLETLPLFCKNCHKTFYRTKAVIVSSFKKHHGYTADFCSLKCSGRFRYQRNIGKTYITLFCNYCLNPMLTKKYQLIRYKHHFCSHSCRAKWNIKYHQKHLKGTRASKLEIWLQQELNLKFPSIYFHFNRKDTINSELDIYIPVLSLAFELNGIFHYEPIHGEDVLSKIQTNDKRKMQACLEKNIELCVIDSSSLKKVKPKNSQKFLDIIVSIMTEKAIRINFKL